MTFTLHPRLAADTSFIADWPLSRVLLMNDSRFPWLILVPRRADLSEFFELDEDARAQLIDEIARASENLKAWARTKGGGEKINVGMIGNMVPQLHVHVVARGRADAAWPGTVWGTGTALPYADAECALVIESLRAVL